MNGLVKLVAGGAAWARRLPSRLGRLSGLSLSQRLLLLAVLGIAPAVGIQIYNEIELRAQRERDMADAALKQAELVSADIGSIVNGAEQMLGTLASSGLVRGLDPRCGERLATVQSKLVGYKAFVVFDTAGQAICATLPGPLNRIVRLPEFDMVIERRDFVIGRYEVGAVSGRPFLAFGYPIEDDAGALQGVIIASLDLQWLGQHLAEFRPTPEGNIVVADRNGVVLAHNPNHEKWVGKRLRAEELALVNAPNPANADVQSPDGRDRLIGFYPTSIKRTGLYVSVGLCQPTMLAALDRALLGGAALILLGAATAIGAALVFGRHLIHAPTQALLNTVGRWATGDLSARVPTHGWRSELDRLGSAFNDMADAVAERDRRLREADRHALQRERDFSRLVVQSSADGIFTFDRQFAVLTWNAQLAWMTGLAEEAVMGRNALEMLPALSSAMLGAQMCDALAGREGKLPERLCHFPASGRSLWLQGEHRPLVASDGTSLGGIVFLRDVTEQRELENSLRQAQKVEAIGQLTSGVAHDFNNLLTACLGNLELAKDRIAARQFDVLPSLVDRATEAAERGATLTAKLLAFARRQHLEMRPFDLNQLIRDALDLLPPMLGPTVRIDARLADGLWPALSDPGQVESALVNLAVNARDAMPAGGTLTIETANLSAGDLRLPASLRGGEHVLFSVRDDGVGMDEIVRARAFEPFFTTKDVGKGTGLGLSMVHGLANQSGGAVAIDSAPGEGTRVIMYLPRASAPAVAARPEAAEAPTVGGTSASRILLVDDDAGVRAFVAQALVGSGHRVTEVESGADAARLFEGGGIAFDLLIVDYAMPGMNGAAVARRARRAQPGLPIVMITGYSDAGGPDLPRGTFILNKPFTIRALTGAIARATREASERASGTALSH
jgi:PAS domain S-box-containing protein